jgi:ATP-binding cassette subfamily B protein
MRANKEKSKSLVRRFVSYYGPYKWLFTADLFSAAINGGVGLVFPAMIRYIINDVFTMPDTSLIAPILTKLAILMFVLYLVEAGSLYFVSSWGHILGARIETDMRHDLFEHMEKLSFSFFDKTSTGKMVSRLISDLGDITELAHHGPENLFISAFKIVGSFIILSRIHFPMSMILLGFTILLVILMFGYRAKMTNVFMDNRRKIAEVNAIVQDSLSGIRTVQSFSNEQIEMEKFHHGNEAFYHSKKRMYFFMGKYFTLNQFMQGMLYLVTLITGGIYVIRGTLRPGDAIAFILYINMYLAPIRTLIMFNEQFQKGMTGFRRMVEILDTEPDIVDRQGAVDAGTLRGTIEFDHVSFSYGEEKSSVRSLVYD